MNSNNAVYTTVVSVPRYETITLPSGGKFRKEVGFDNKIVRVYVDLAAIASALGGKACQNKSGSARYLKGAVIIEDTSK